MLLAAGAVKGLSLLKAHYLQVPSWSLVKANYLQVGPVDPWNAFVWFFTTKLNIPIYLGKYSFAKTFLKFTFIKIEIEDDVIGQNPQNPVNQEYIENLKNTETANLHSDIIDLPLMTLPFEAKRMYDDYLKANDNDKASNDNDDKANHDNDDKANNDNNPSIYINYLEVLVELQKERANYSEVLADLEKDGNYSQTRFSRLVLKLQAKLKTRFSKKKQRGEEDYVFVCQNKNDNDALLTIENHVSYMNCKENKIYYYKRIDEGTDDPTAKEVVVPASIDHANLPTSSSDRQVEEPNSLLDLYEVPNSTENSLENGLYTGDDDTHSIVNLPTSSTATTEVKSAASTSFLDPNSVSPNFQENTSLENFGGRSSPTNMSSGTNNSNIDVTNSNTQECDNLENGSPEILGPQNGNVSGISSGSQQVIAEANATSPGFMAKGKAIDNSSEENKVTVTEDPREVCGSFSTTMIIVAVVVILLLIIIMTICSQRAK